MVLTMRFVEPADPARHLPFLLRVQMGPVMRVIRTHPLLAFFVLTYALTWWVAPLSVTGFPVFPYGPDLAALLVVGVSAGRTGIGRLLRQLAVWRISPLWYCVALGLPALIGVTATAATGALGAPAASMPGPVSLLEFVLVLPVMVLVGGPLGEELGWRGYALPALVRDHRPLTAVGLLGLAHLLWHLPLFFADGPPSPAPFAIDLLSGGVVLAWLLFRTRSLLLVVLTHAAHNMSQQAFMEGFTGRDLVVVQWAAALGWAAAALVIIWRTHGTLGFVSPSLDRAEELTNSDGTTNPSPVK
jgi:membrane protease YdiL (CAAX protease family)